MSEMRDLVSQIREYEINAATARKTNEQALPKLKAAIADIEKFGFGNDDLDLKKRMLAVSGQIIALEVDGITEEVLKLLTREVSAIMAELIKRYRDRMEAYASRQSNL